MMGTEIRSVAGAFAAVLSLSRSANCFVLQTSPSTFLRRSAAPLVASSSQQLQQGRHGHDRGTHCERTLMMGECEFSHVILLGIGIGCCSATVQVRAETSMGTAMGRSRLDTYMFMREAPTHVYVFNSKSKIPIATPVQLCSIIYAALRVDSVCTYRQHPKRPIQGLSSIDVSTHASLLAMTHFALTPIVYTRQSWGLARRWHGPATSGV